MAELYKTGSNRLVYRSVGFATGLTVTAYIWSPALEKSDLQTFTEVELGLYYLDYTFATMGTYFGLFYEDDVAKTSGIFRVTQIGIPKNIALANLMFTMVLSSDGKTPATGKSIAAQISKDGGAFANCTNAVSEVGQGWYKLDLTQSEMNADIVALNFTEADCLQRNMELVTT